eukprot:595423-Prymnesium_polylepis.1
MCVRVSSRLVWSEASQRSQRTLENLCASGMLAARCGLAGRMFGAHIRSTSGARAEHHVRIL